MRWRWPGIRGDSRCRRRGHRPRLGSATAAFRGYFALAPPAELTALTAVTRGDFAVVRRKAEILDRLTEPDTLAAMLRDECDATPDRRRALGFRP